MARQLTKQQKRRIQQRRQQQLGMRPQVVETQSSVQAMTSGVSKPVSGGFSDALSKAMAQQHTAKPATQNLDLQSFFGFDPKLIYQDLTKTMVISVAILILLVVFSRLPF